MNEKLKYIDEGLKNLTLLILTVRSISSTKSKIRNHISKKYQQQYEKVLNKKGGTNTLTQKGKCFFMKIYKTFTLKEEIVTLGLQPFVCDLCSYTDHCRPLKRELTYCLWYLEWYLVWYFYISISLTQQSLFGTFLDLHMSTFL